MTAKGDFRNFGTGVLNWWTRLFIFLSQRNLTFLSPQLKRGFVLLRSIPFPNHTTIQNDEPRKVYQGQNFHQG